jgi:electron transfer flavoprotein alpha subunit
MATVRPGIYAPEFKDGAHRKEIPAGYFEKDTNKLINIIEEVSLNQNPLIDARVIVSGGQGIGPGGFMKLLQFAKLIGASVGASRGAVSAGYAPYMYQIGLTGITVRPDIYVAFGISGAIQHIVGMSNAGYVAAVNPDEKAPIFEYTDLAIFATWEETIDQMMHRFGSKKE